MPIIENIIHKLRPASGKASDIAAALALATTAATEQDTATIAAKAARDDALLDAEPSVLRKAEQALAEAREQAERISAVRASLQQRHTAALEAEALERIEVLRAEAEDTDAALSAWWVKTRVKLAAELSHGNRLQATHSEARYAFDQAVRAAAESYPQHTFRNPARPAVDAGFWSHDLQGAASMATTFDNSFDTLLTSGDPKPAGTF